MEMKQLIDKIFAAGQAYGLKDMEVYYSSASSLMLKVFKGELDGYKLSQSEGLSLRGVYNNKMGYSYTEKVDETSIDMLVREAAENATIIDSDDEEEIFAGSPHYREVNNYNPALDNVGETAKIDFTKNLEKSAYEADSRISSVESCVYGDGSGETVMANTKGLYLQEKSNIAYTYVVVVAKDGEQIKNGMAYRSGNDFAEFKAEEIAREAVQEAVSMLGASQVKSGDYRVVLRNNVFGDLLDAFSGIFSAETVQKDLSLLKGKIGQQIGSSVLTIIDDPFMDEGLASRSFDGEGAACLYKKVIDKGVLKTYLHNLKTAKKDNVETTGNASKSSYKSPVDISPTNFYVENGNVACSDMLKTLNDGLFITDIQGLHAGLNAISGDFSLLASGYEIKNGSIKRPVEQITVAGNFFDIMRDIEAVADDIKFGLPGEAYIGSPSVLVKKLAVAGE